MNSNYCNDKCNQSSCPFRTDPFDSYREVCVKCGKDYSFRRYRFSTFFILWALIGCIFLLTNNNFQVTESQPITQPLLQDLESRS